MPYRTTPCCRRGLFAFFLACLAAVWLAPAGLAAADALPEGIVNTQPPGESPPSPEQAAAMLTAPEGFRVTLFAGEPAVAQPISLAFDDRGRLWVAECYSYPQWNGTPRDRILIFEDTNHDGRYDRRTVFQAGLNNLTSIQLGCGGVWAIASPNLLFFPDADGNDVPDAAPTILLDGFDTKKIGHNIANGLTWGPDGWLYACHGILSESKLGPPGAAEADRVRINCGVWRYHPVRKVVEVVAHGTTNPWGLDFDEEGEAYFINCVIGHLWHLRPGAHYERMYGEHYRPHLYELIGACSDHLHWGGGHWTESRGGQGKHSEAGGGHAHCGLVIYNGANFPERYRGVALMGNLHGNRLNCDRLADRGSGKVARHEADFLTSTNPWFRPTALAVGPDGGLFIADWCDLGECHDNDGVHRTSGRIYKVRFGEAGAAPSPVDWARLSPRELVPMALHGADAGRRRRALRALYEGEFAGAAVDDALPLLQAALLSPAAQRSPLEALRALWCLSALQSEEVIGLAALASHPDPRVAAWSVRLIGDRPEIRPLEVAALVELGQRELPHRVRAALASLLPRLKLDDRLQIAAGLLKAEGLDDDPGLPQLVWYGLEPAVAAQPARALALLAGSRSRKLSAWTARRVISADPQAGLAAIVATLGRIDPAEVRLTVMQSWLDLLEGTLDALRGQRGIAAPADWPAAYARLRAVKHLTVRDRAEALALVLGDAEAIARHKALAAQAAADAAARATAIERLVERREPDLVPLLLPLLDDAAVRRAAIRGLSAYDDARIAPALLARYERLNRDEQAAALDCLASRPGPALALLAAVERRQLPVADVSAYHVRQMLNLKDAQIAAELDRVWGRVRPTTAERQAQIARYKELLAPAALTAADASRGRALYARTCAQCHKLYGEGGTLGPDLTGSNRANLDYILENVLDPSAKIGRGYELTAVELKDGRTVIGLATTRDENSIALQTATQTLIVPLADIERRETSKSSLMPEGIWDKLEIDAIRDLVLYLQSKDQVPLPAAAGR